jgi:hypothetical protein
MNEIEMEIRLELDSREEAISVGKALKVDDDEFVFTEIRGRVVTARIRAGSIESARRAADDWMACALAVING